MKSKVFIAKSIDGFIADKNGGIEWLQSVPNPSGLDMGYNDFIKSVDAIIMGRVTFETVLGFDIEWPYEIPVFVLSNSLKNVPDNLKSKVEIVNGELNSILNSLIRKGYHNFYIDGGTTIQSFLKEDLIDELIITTIPVILGGGFPLFTEINRLISFDHKDTKVYLDQIVQTHYIKKGQLLE